MKNSFCSNRFTLDTLQKREHAIHTINDQMCVIYTLAEVSTLEEYLTVEKEPYVDSFSVPYYNSLYSIIKDFPI